MVNEHPLSKRKERLHSFSKKGKTGLQGSKKFLLFLANSSFPLSKIGNKNITDLTITMSYMKQEADREI